MQRDVEAWPGCFLRGRGAPGPAWAGLLPGRNPPTEGYTCVCFSAAGVGWGRGGGGLLKQEEEVGLGGGVGKGEVLHHAWALKAKASRARRPNTGPPVEQAGSVPLLSGRPVCWDSHTHSLQDSGGLYHLPAQASGLPGLELPSSDESSQSSSLLCVTQSRGSSNLESRACLVGGSRGVGVGALPTSGPAVPPLEPQTRAPRRRE